MSGPTHPLRVFSELTVALASTSDPEVRTKLAVSAATSVLDSCSHAAFTVEHTDGLFVEASNDDTVRRANDLQRELGEGPCWDLRRDQDLLVSSRLAEERRWPRWAPRVHEELDVGSLISVLVHSGAESYGALTVYATNGTPFDEDDVVLAHVLAEQLAVMVTLRREIDQLHRAVLSRTTIGQAQGILMERLDIDSARAFDYLRRISSHTNLKVTAIASEIACTRQLPGGPSSVRLSPTTP